MIICVCSIGIFGTFWVFWKNHVEGDEEHLAVFGCCVFPADFPAAFMNWLRIFLRISCFRVSPGPRLFHLKRTNRNISFPWPKRCVLDK
jgi:hypothetical protein